MDDRKLCPLCGDEYDSTVAFCAKDGTSLVSAAPAQADLVGTIVGGRYRVVSRIGEGGMGQVYLAEHIRMKRRSAIKIMRPALVGDSEALQRFTREAENASKINHPNVASIFDFGETDEGLVYLAMEFVEGEALSATLKREIALHPAVAADVIAQAADALQAAHDLGILHRDFKPDNLMLSKRADSTFIVKLVDFGIARTIDRSTQQVTRTGFAVGTPEFMSPEQLSGDVLDGRSDQYSLALVAFVALTGHDAFANSSSKESMIARLTSRPRRLDEVREDLEWPNSLQDVFDRALAPDPVDRFESVAQFGVDLADAIYEMTPTETAEIYRHALGQRLSSVASRTPLGDPAIGRTPAAGEAVQKTKQEAAVGKKTKKRPPPPARTGQRGSVVPYLFMVALGIYGVYWYGSKQSSGTAREAADKIGSAYDQARAKVDSLVNKPEAVDSTPVVVEPEVVVPKKTERRRPKVDPAAAAAAATPSADSAQKAPVVSPPPAKVETTVVRTDTLSR